MEGWRCKKNLRLDVLSPLMPQQLMCRAQLRSRWFGLRSAYIVLKTAVLWKWRRRWKESRNWWQQGRHLPWSWRTEGAGRAFWWSAEWGQGEWSAGKTWPADWAQTQISSTSQGCERRHSSSDTQTRPWPGLPETDAGRSAGWCGGAGYPSLVLKSGWSWTPLASVA